MSVQTQVISPAVRQRASRQASIAAIVAGAVLAFSALLPWSNEAAVYDDLTRLGSPSMLQWFGFTLGLLIIGLAVGARTAGARPAEQPATIGWVLGVRSAAVGALVYVAMIIAGAALEFSSVGAIGYGGWIALAGALVAVGASQLPVAERNPDGSSIRLKAWQAVLAVVLILAAAAGSVSYLFGLDDAGTVVIFVAYLGILLAVLVRSDLVGWIGTLPKTLKKAWTISAGTQERWGGLGRIIGIAGGAVLAASAYLPWAYAGAAPALDDMSFLGGPSQLQFFGLGLGVLIIVAILLSKMLPAGSVPARIGWSRTAKAASTGAVFYLLMILVNIAIELNGLINIDYGGWIALAGAVAALAGTRLLLAGPDPTIGAVKMQPWQGILGIAVAMGIVLFVAYYALQLRESGSFLSFLVFLAVAIVVVVRSGVLGWLTAATQQYRKTLILSAFVVAFLFPFTQGGSNANMSIATQVLIFAATAMGLNIVVGLAGLLDLGYIAFLGAGAFTAAILSNSVYSTVGWHPPFIVVILISGGVSAILGLIIGSPTLRVSGDYLAIVTLAFGEIFRFTVTNLDGQDGPMLTGGSDGIPGVPDLNLLGFDFGAVHVIAGIAVPRFANYFFLLLVLIGVIILIFSRLNNSRIGRGWVAIREDEKAAEAMGVNVFGLKIFAFAGGAFLAGVAGSVKAHHDISVTPDQYIFLESAFLVAAIVLGGMGTVLGVLIGATLLKLMPEKLRFFNEYRLLIFGLLLVVMMRFRPEGLVASQRRQLEFHEEDEELAERIDEEIAETGAVKGTS